jgi:hypothetical protein
MKIESWAYLGSQGCISRIKNPNCLKYSVFHDFISPLIFLEIKMIIKIEYHPYNPVNLWLILIGMKQKEYFVLKKNKSKWPTQKNWDFQLPQFSIFFAKISWIDPWVSRINWCEGHWCGIVRLSNRYRTIFLKWSAQGRVF